MRKSAYLLLITGLCMAGGCVLTLDSLFTSKDVTYDPALEGVWKLEGATWTIKPLDVKGGRYRLQTEMKDQPTERWYCTLGLVGTNRFLELLPQRPGEIHPKTFFGGHFMELRSFWKVALNGDTLTLTSMSSQWLDTMLKQNKVSIKHEQRDGHVLFLTAPTPDLQDFVAQYANDPGAFPSNGDEKGMQFVRDGAKPIPQTSLRLPEATDADLGALKDKQYLRELFLVHSKVTDAGLTQISALQGLQMLDISFSQVTDVGLVHLKEMKGLQTLNLRETKITDAGLTNLTEMTNLRVLNLQCQHVTDAGLEHLKDMQGLQTLMLEGAQVSDKGLKFLKEMRNLQTLDLSYTRVTDSGLAELKEMNGLQSLNLARTSVTEAGLRNLKGLTNLQTLNLRGSTVAGDGGLENLREMKALHTLDIGDTKRRTPPAPLVFLTDEGLAYLKDLTALENLDLCFAHVTDAGLAELRDMRSLHHLNLVGTKVTKAGIEELKKALPSIEIAN